MCACSEIDLFNLRVRRSEILDGRIERHDGCSTKMEK